MSLQELQQQEEAVRLLQRSLERDRLGHAYLFSGSAQDRLLSAARNLAKTLHCENPPRRSDRGQAVDSCDQCPSCLNIDQDNHADVLWIRPESKSRIITIDQMRDLMKTVHLKPTHGAWKVAIIVASDRLKQEAANAFLKTLEEPPSNSVLILLSTDPQRILDTILSRCLRLNFSGDSGPALDDEFREWMAGFSQMAAEGSRSLLSRYRLLSVFLERLTGLKDQINEALTQRSPLEQHEDADARLRDKWEDELSASIEAEYRYQRSEQLGGLQWWFRDVWLAALNQSPELFAFPDLASDAQLVASRISAREAMGNLRQLEQTQRLLHTNVQEALALEVGLLKLRL